MFGNGIEAKCESRFDSVVALFDLINKNLEFDSLEPVTIFEEILNFLKNYHLTSNLLCMLTKPQP